VVVADPSWSFGDKLPGKSRGAEKNYPVMSVEDICLFDDFHDQLVSPNAVLFLWRVSSQVEEAYRVVRAWGFTPKTELVWRKLTTGGLPWFGMGRYLRAAHETCIVAVRGKMPPKVRNVRSVFDARAGRHSEKPEEFFSLVEGLYDGPYLELFARRRREGWTCLGNELPQPAETAPPKPKYVSPICGPDDGLDPRSDDDGSDDWGADPARWTDLDT
jgi:N6-adenosine-specific RNA methylase IME4